MQNDDMENIPIENNGRRWQFWFLVSFSLLLVVTFVFYLPTRFERNFLRGDHPMEDMPHMDGEMRNDEHTQTRYHEESQVQEGLVVNLNVSPVPVVRDTLTSLDFFVNQKPGNAPVHFGLLETDHAKLMHVIGVRSDLNEFFHIHPEPTDEFGVLATSYIFKKPGSYKIWSEVTSDGVVHSFGHPVIEVQGEGFKEQKNVSFERNVSVGDYQATLQIKEPVAEGHEHDVSFDIHTLGGEEVELENFLGVPMHLAVIKDDLSQFIHTHPEEMGGQSHGFLPFVQEVRAHGEVIDDHDTSAEGDEAVNFHVTFPKAGLYKLFAQFRPAGVELPGDEALMASFWVEVKENSGTTPADHHESTQLQPLVSSAWWLLLVVSLVAIALLSFAIHKFITVKK